MSNVNAVKAPRVSIEAGGKSRTLLFDLNSFAELERKYGSVDAAMTKLQSGSVIAARDMLWAGLIHEEAVLDEVTGEPIKYNITPFQVGSWLTVSDIESISGLINAAMASSMTQPDETSTPKAPVVPAGVAKVELTEEEKAEQAKNA
ncbi:hypothetical protein D3C75_158460 [compost metagenome]